jgi:DNA segregation ATPase FtsK/SpoIIIE, S-DNA-T family
MDHDIEKAIHFFLVQKIQIAEIKKTPLGSFDVFDVYPQFGVKLGKLSRCLQDFALYMGCLGIPDADFDYTTGSYRIKLQRREVDTMPLSHALALLPAGMLSPMVLGCTALGGPLVVDQGAVPNTLVAGAPGSGKSTLLKVMIENLLLAGVGVTIIDPKLVDFALFKKRSGCQVESDPEKFGQVLDSVISRMNSIYSILSRRGFSSVFQNNNSGGSKIYPQVIFIDEWADVLLSDKKNLSRVLTLSQKGRAAGISIVLATQRPSASILPGQIKANFTGRIAMRVSSEMESRMIMNSSLAADISEPGMAYYMDQSSPHPIYFRVAQNDLTRSDPPQKSTSFWSNLMSVFK